MFSHENAYIPRPVAAEQGFWHHRGGGENCAHTIMRLRRRLCPVGSESQMHSNGLWKYILICQGGQPEDEQ